MPTVLFTVQFSSFELAGRGRPFPAIGVAAGGERTHLGSLPRTWSAGLYSRGAGRSRRTIFPLTPDPSPQRGEGGMIWHRAGCTGPPHLAIVCATSPAPGSPEGR